MNPIFKEKRIKIGSRRRLPARETETKTENEEKNEKRKTKK